MNEQPKKNALDDYFSSMLNVSVPDSSTAPSDLSVARVVTYAQEPILESVQETVPVDFAEPEVSESSLQDLDQLLETVVDIEIDDLELLDLDLMDLTEELNHSQDIQDEVDNAIDELISVEQHTAHSEIEAVIEPANEKLDIIPPQPPEWKNIELENEFQALFFEVAGVTFAVPLTELGGIYQTDNINTLFGKPNWFLGMMQHREQKFSVVDTVKWVMPEQNLTDIDYKYQIRLSESSWVLGSEVLLGNETLTQSDIKWRTTAGTRPWLAGMVKSRMCVLLHVTEMIKLLDNGINIQGQ